ncbi:MAG TPA: histidine kinase [Chitinophagaceae bacterium]|nr:histidine kinase [Chitinophagaceae bacterium]
MNRRRLLIVLMVLPALQLAGQQLAEHNFDRYTSETGLSNNYVTGILQDSTGYIWIATSSGLNRFNGSRFVQFRSTDDSLSLAAEELTGLVWLDKYRMAVFTYGLHVVDTRTGKSRNVFIPYHDKKLQYKLNVMVTALGDDKGNIYILTRSGFYHFDKNYQLVYRFDYYSREGLLRTHTVFGREMLELDDRRLLITSIAGTYIYDKQTRKFKGMTPEDCPVMEGLIGRTDFYRFFQLQRGQFFVMRPETDTLFYVDALRNKKVLSHLPFVPGKMEFHYRTRICKANDTLLYITGHSSGFYKARFHPGTGQIQLDPEKYFRAHLCLDVFVDKQQHLWVGSSKGLFRQNPLRSQVAITMVPQYLQDSLPNLRLDDVFATAEKLYAGARADGGMLVYDKKTLKFERRITFNKINKYYGNNIYGIVQTDPSSLLLARDGTFLKFDLATKRENAMVPPQWGPGDWISDILKDSKGNIWITSSNIYRYNPATDQFKVIHVLPQLLSMPVVIGEDRDGNIWMAGHGLARYNNVLGKFDLYLDSFPFLKMQDRQVGAMAIDKHNTVWFNSINNGLIGYDIDKGTYRHFTRSHGLPDNNIASMAIVDDQLWMACVTGLACMDLTTSRIVSFGGEDGFPDLPVIKGSRFFYDSTTRHLYVGLSTVIARFNPHDMLRRKSIPHVFVESVVIAGQKNCFLPDASVTTSWKNSEIRVTIGTINFADGAGQRYAYRIVKDSASPWINMGTQPSFSISSLSAGTHRIQVKVFSPNNRWAEQVKEMTVVVLPPLWQQDWFRALMALVMIALVYLLIKWRTGLARKKEMVKTHIEKLKADDYKNQFELEQISNYFSSSLTGKTTIDEVLWDVTNNLIGRLNYVDCMIYLWNEDKTKMMQKAAYGPKGTPELISSQVFDVLPGQGVVGHVMETRQPVLIHDTRKDSRYRVDDEFRLSEVCVPIIHNDELMGILDSEHYLPNYFSERDIKILTTIATLIGNKLKQLESEQSLDAKRKELATINEQLAEARLAALQAQMNPHFVFNALNSIKRMILDGDNEKASRYLSKFALMIRMTLNHSKEIFVTLDENIAYLRAYLEMEQLRFDDSFTYKIVTGDNIEASETPIPSMMIQPLVENAIWHGLMQAGSDKRILIGFAQQENKITCTVEDNGIGILQSQKLKEKSKSPHVSVGLENLQKRIKIMNDKYDMDCKLIIRDLHEMENNGHTGTRVVLQFNLVNA